MKRFAILPLLVIYVLTTVGISAYMHFCGGELEAFEFTNIQTNDCCCSDDTEQSDCCRDTQISIKTVDIHQQVPSSSLPNLLPTVYYTIISYVLQETFSTFNYSIFSSYSHAPPPLARNNPLFILLCSFLI
jgi:hypothetical protein